MYAPGGEYMAGTEAGLERGQKKAVATGMQNLAASGMAGTSMAGGLGMMYEEDIAAPTRARATTERLGALAGLLQQQAGTEAQLASRYTTTTGAAAGGGGGGYMPSAAPTRRPAAAAAAPAKAKVPTLSAFPSLTTAKQPTGYQGVYFGKAFYDKQKKAAAPETKGSFYSDFLSRGGTPTSGGLKGLDPYGISTQF
jgi:hypothetical protein